MRWRVMLLVCGFALSPVVPLVAQDVAVRGTVTPQPVSVNSQFVLKVEVSGTQQIDGSPTPPDLEFAEYLGSGTNTSMRMVNGQTSVSVAVQFRFRATREGTFTIPPVTVRAGGSTLQSDPIQLTVTRNTGATTAARPDGSVVEIPRDALFVTATPNKRSVYVNEPVVVEYRIYTQVPVEGYSVTETPSAAGFWVEELDTPPRPQVETVTRNGREYASALVGRRALFPTGAGAKTIAPLGVEAQVRVDRRRRDPLDIFGGGLFAERVPVVVTTDSIEVEVLPLPATGRPSEFTGFVGALQVSASLDKTETGTNEALTYTLRISGDGNVRTLPEPSIEFPDAFEVYPPETAENIDRSGNRVRGSKTYEYVLIPRVSGTHTIPAIQYGYFDASADRYAVAAADPIRVSVTGESGADALIATGGRGAVTTLRRDIRFIRVAMPNFERRDTSLLRSAGFWLVVLAPLSVLGAAVGVRRHHDRLAGDVALARGRRAGKAARRRLASARAQLRPEAAKAFHAEVARALRGFLGDKLNVAEAGILPDDIRPKLENRRVTPDVLDEYFACMDLCDRYRFAPVDVTAGEMTALLERAERMMTEMERALR